MAPTTLTPPARSEEQAPDAAPAPAHRAPLTAAPRRSPTGRVTRRALVLSLALHVVLGIGVLLIPVIRPGPAPRPVPRDSVTYLDLAAFPAPAGDPAGEAGGGIAAPQQTAVPRDTAGGAPAPALRFPERVPVGVPAPGAGEAEAGVAGGTGVGARGRGGAAGGRLGAQLGDSRLVVRPEGSVERQRTDAERYQDRLNLRLGVIGDSIAEEERRRYRTRNWTVRDKGGREWGIGEGGVPVIAGRRVPIPLPLPVVQRDRDADNAERERVRRWGEIQDQAETQDRDAVLRERARETRRRLDNERRRQRGEAVTDTARRAP